MFSRAITLGHYLNGQRKLPVRVRIEVTTKPEGNVLSICGEVGIGLSCIAGGQINDSLAHYLTEPAYPTDAVERLAAIWQRWHLNDMRAGCEHQRAAQWDKLPLDPSKPTDAYVEHPDGHKGWNMLAWVPEAKGGVLGKACEVCGYRYGTKWLYEPLPDAVLANLRLWPLMPNLSVVMPTTPPIVVACRHCDMSMWSASASAFVDAEGSILCRSCAKMPAVPAA